MQEKYVKINKKINKNHHQPKKDRRKKGKFFKKN